MSNPGVWTGSSKSPIGDPPYSILSSICLQQQLQQLCFRHEFNSGRREDANETKVQILAVTHNGLYTLRGIKRTRLLHPHASPYVASYRKATETGTGYQGATHTSQGGIGKPTCAGVVYAELSCLCVCGMWHGCYSLYDSLALD